MSEKNILFLSKGLDAASTRYRALTYFEPLKSSGWQPIHIGMESARSRAMALHQASKAKVVVVVRKTFAPAFLFLLRRLAEHLVFDLDDAIFLKSDGSMGSGSREKRFSRIAACCDQVWVGNEYLAEHAQPYNECVYQLPTSVNMSAYDKVAQKNSDYLDIVWIGSQSTGKYLRGILPTLEKAAVQLPQLRLKVIADFELHSQQLTVLNIPWTQETEAQSIADSHIGIAPMTDDPWTKGKCGLKLLQYMASGLPVITSPYGVNAEIIEHGKTGLLVENSNQWIEALQTLAHKEARDVMGKEGYKHCAKFYSVATTYQRMEKLLCSFS